MEYIIIGIILFWIFSKKESSENKDKGVVCPNCYTKLDMRKDATDGQYGCKVCNREFIYMNGVSKRLEEVKSILRDTDASFITVCPYCVKVLNLGYKIDQDGNHICGICKNTFVVSHSNVMKSEDYKKDTSYSSSLSKQDMSELSVDSQKYITEEKDDSEGHYTVSDTPTKDKKMIIDFLVNIVADDLRHSFSKDEYRFYMDKLKNINNADMETLYNDWMSDLNYEISSYIKKSVKESYGGSRALGLSSEEKNEFITNLRMAFRAYRI